jgi:hypothetical protein
MRFHTTLLCAIMSVGVLAAPTAEAAPAAEAAAIAEAAPDAEAAQLAPRSGEYLGGVAMDDACSNEYGNLYFAEERGSGCGDWSCAYLNFFIRGLHIDVPAQCARQYGAGVYAWCSKGSRDWGCYRS